jgi:hypothetical protein
MKHNLIVMSLVMLSVLLAPVALAATRSGAAGVGGGARIVTDRDVDVALTFPARSVICTAKA